MHSGLISQDKFDYYINDKTKIFSAKEVDNARHNTLTFLLKNECVLYDKSNNIEIDLAEFVAKKLKIPFDVDNPNFVALHNNLKKTLEKECMEVAFFNVGQGNASVVKPADSKNVWVFDAGSKKNPQNILDNSKFPKQEVSQAIYDYICQDSDKKTAHVVLSHPDEDHYNMISDIFFMAKNRDKLKEACFESVTFYVSKRYINNNEEFPLAQHYGFSYIKPVYKVDIEQRMRQFKTDYKNELAKLNDSAIAGHLGFELRDHHAGVGQKTEKRFFKSKDGKEKSASKQTVIATLINKCFKEDKTLEENIHALMKDDERRQFCFFSGLTNLKEQLMSFNNNIYYTYPNVDISPTNNKFFKVSFMNTGSKFGVSDEDKNHNSLVAKVTCADTSVLFTGDATKKTYTEIDSNKIKDIDIYQASHHGAQTEENKENDIKLIKSTINPQYVVLSAPQISSYRHPSWYLIEEIDAFTSRLNQNVGYHYLFLDKNISPIDLGHDAHKKYVATYQLYDAQGSKSDERFSIYATEKGIFHTGSQGTIIFKTKKDNSIRFKTYDYKINTNNIVQTSSLISNEASFSDLTKSIFQNDKNIIGLNAFKRSELSLLKTHSKIQALNLKNLDASAHVKLNSSGEIEVDTGHESINIDHLPFVRANKEQLDDMIDQTKPFVKKFFGVAP